MVFDEPIHLVPIVGPRRCKMFVGTVGEADREMAVPSKALDVAWAVFDIDVCSHLVLLLHEAEVPVRNAVMIQPVNGLCHGKRVEIPNDQAV